MDTKASSECLHKITRVRLPNKPSNSLWDISISDGRIATVHPHADNETVRGYQSGPTVLDGRSCLLAPSLCHAHIHLDKCFLLYDPKFADLQIESGDFDEAMDLTGKAKSRFEEDDLLRRGSQLIEESINHGVTAMRAFVEVDEGVQFKCLDAGLRLRDDFEGRCEVQICAFAQLPLFSGSDNGEVIRQLMASAARTPGVDVLGSTPYVEEDVNKSKMNVEWISNLALKYEKHLDLHLDYFLEQNKEPLIFDALNILKNQEWPKHDKQITLGHCTRLTRFNEEDWQSLKRSIGGLPINFVGLPTSDLFMMRTEEMLRGTLPVVDMIQRHGLRAAIAVNNVGNAFTPHGNCDPLSIASLGVGIYQAGTKKDTDILYESVSTRAKTVIGTETTSLALAIGEPADFCLYTQEDTSWRSRHSIAQVVYDAGTSRTTIRRGKITHSE